jgi:CRP/FNR family transcriptional regulator, dissimilatory nitrate respiration regulator
MYVEWMQALRSARLFQGIGPESLNIMLDCLKPRIKRVKMREVVVACGQPYLGLGIVAAGKVALVRETYSGNRIMMGILQSGEIFGEVVAFSDLKTWPMTVIAQEDGVVLFLPPDKITGTCSNICLSHSRLIVNMLRILSNHALLLDRKIEHLSARDLRGKISSYLLGLYTEAGRTTLEVPMKRHELADYLGMARPSLSREMARMRQEGIIDFDRSQITVKNPVKLEESIP